MTSRGDIRSLIAVSAADRSSPNFTQSHIDALTALIWLSDHPPGEASSENAEILRERRQRPLHIADYIAELKKFVRFLVVKHGHSFENLIEKGLCILLGKFALPDNYEVVVSLCLRFEKLPRLSQRFILHSYSKKLQKAPGEADHASVNLLWRPIAFGDICPDFQSEIGKVLKKSWIGMTHTSLDQAMWLSGEFHLFDVAQSLLFVGPVHRVDRCVRGRYGGKASDQCLILLQRIEFTPEVDPGRPNYQTEHGARHRDKPDVASFHRSIPPTRSYSASQSWQQGSGDELAGGPPAPRRRE